METCTESSLRTRQAKEKPLGRLPPPDESETTGNPGEQRVEWLANALVDVTKS